MRSPGKEFWHYKHKWGRSPPSAAPAEQPGGVARIRGHLYMGTLDASSWRSTPRRQVSLGGPDFAIRRRVTPRPGADRGWRAEVLIGHQRCREYASAFVKAFDAKTGKALVDVSHDSEGHERRRVGRRNDANRPQHESGTSRRKKEAACRKGGAFYQTLRRRVD